MLPSSPHVRQVYLDSSGIISTLRSMSPVDASNTLCIDSTTLDVQVGRDVTAEAQAAGAGMVDAPVSGGMPIVRLEGICQVFNSLQV
jgi:3-hydroxyisobutyrate dehydrogenase